MPQANYINQDELSKIYGTGSMEALGQGAQQAGLSQLFQQQEGQKNALANRQAELANIFKEQQDPQLLEHQSLQNAGLSNQNVLGGVNARRAAANEGMQLNEDQRKFALTATDQDLQAAMQHAQGEMNSGDPQRMQEASKILDFTTAARAAKAKAAADLIQEQTQGRNRLAGIGMQTAAQERMNQANIDAGKFNKAGRSSSGLQGIQEAVQSGKMTAEKAAVALHGAAMFEADPDVKQKYEAMAGQYEQFAMNQRNAQAGGKLDIGAATGMPTQQIAPALGGGVSPAPSTQGPQKGQIYKGHVFLGGDPSNKANWKAQ
ncbi:MAG: hypothetical protein WAV48_04865 [Candidatus Magasanikiibacteriota bacterium]